MPLPSLLEHRQALPVIAAPMFLISTPEMVLAQCVAGVVGSLPALNARSADMLSAWLTTLDSDLACHQQVTGKAAAPYAVNLILHPGNGRLHEDLAICEAHRVPIVITSMSVRQEVVARIQGWGGIVLHDVINARHARKAIAQGVDGLILVAAGAGGHAGNINPFALVREIRRFYAGTVILGGAIADGAGILAAQALGADMVYMGTRFIATVEASASAEYKQMLLDAQASDILYTPQFSVASANFLKASVQQAGFDPETALPLDVARDNNAIAWRDIWSAGHGVGVIDDLPATEELVSRLCAEYQAARAGLIRA